MTAMTEQKFSEFFAVMGGIYGHKWSSQYGDDPDSITARVWRDGLVSLELTQVASAIRYYKNHSLSAGWPPSIPEFRLQAMDLPSLRAYRHDLSAKQLTPFVLLASNYLDTWRLSHADAKEHDRLTEDAYRLALDDIERGVPMPEVLPVIEKSPEPPPAPRTPPTPEELERVRKLMEEIRRSFE